MRSARSGTLPGPENPPQVSREAQTTQMLGSWASGFLSISNSGIAPEVGGPQGAVNFITDGLGPAGQFLGAQDLPLVPAQEHGPVARLETDPGHPQPEQPGRRGRARRRPARRSRA